MRTPGLPLHLVTVWHPDKFLDLPVTNLSSLPAMKRIRAELEKKREDEARAHNLEIFFDYFHGRRVSNRGKPVYRLRRTWLPSDRLTGVLVDYDVRLIDTLEEGSQARYKFEFRPSWTEEPHVLDAKLISVARDNIRCAKRLCVRQLWRNPLEAKFGLLPLEINGAVVSEVGNLVLGPFEQECQRAASLRFEKKDRLWWLTY